MSSSTAAEANDAPREPSQSDAQGGAVAPATIETSANAATAVIEVQESNMEAASPPPTVPQPPGETVADNNPSAAEQAPQESFTTKMDDDMQHLLDSVQLMSGPAPVVLTATAVVSPNALCALPAATAPTQEA